MNITPARSVQQLEEERKQLMKAHAEKLENLDVDRRRREELERKQLTAQVSDPFIRKSVIRWKNYIYTHCKSPNAKTVRMPQ